jgi:hypothetical protein
MTAEYPHGDEPLIPMPALSLPALRQAVATVAPSRLPEFFQEIQDAFTQAGDEDSIFPLRHFYQLGRRHRHRAAALRRRPAPRRRTSPRRPRPHYPGPGNPGGRRDRPGSLSRGHRWLPPGLRTVQRGQLMLVYLPDVRGERVVIIQVNWIS